MICENCKTDLVKTAVNHSGYGLLGVYTCQCDGNDIYDDADKTIDIFGQLPSENLKAELDAFS